MAEEIKNQGQQENAENLNENVSGGRKKLSPLHWKRLKKGKLLQFLKKIQP